MTTLKPTEPTTLRIRTSTLEELVVILPTFRVATRVATTLLGDAPLLKKKRSFDIKIAARTFYRNIRARLMKLTLTTPFTTRLNGPMDETTILTTWPAPLLTIFRTITLLHTTTNTQTTKANTTFKTEVILVEASPLSLLLLYPTAPTPKPTPSLLTTRPRPLTPQEVSPLLPKHLDSAPLTAPPSFTGTRPREQSAVVAGPRNKLLATPKKVKTLPLGPP